MSWMYSPLLSGSAVLLGGASLVSISVSPSSPSITAGNTQAFTATGTYSDLSTADLTSSVTWSSSDTSVATMSSATATGVAAGSCTITALDSGTGISGTTTLSVTLATVTLDELRTGSLRSKFVAAIEGYEWLLTDANTDSAVAAWSGTDWTQALGGLSVQMAREQKIDPWNPFQRSGTGNVILRVLPDSTDRFGIDAHRRTAGAETSLTATVDRAATTLPVKDTSGFPSSGVVYCGTESIAYTGTTATSFTGCTRGQFSPFQTARATNFAEHHRVGADALGVELEPVVSAQPRVWLGRWVGVWMHVTDGTNLNAKSSAQLVWAGRIASIADDPNTGCTAVEVKSVLDAVNDSTLGRDMWSAKVQSGFPIAVGDTLTFQDNDYNGSWKVANPLVVVASGASGTNQINAGTYDLPTLASTINSWLAAEYHAARIFGTYFLNSAENVDPNGGTDIRARFHWYITSTAAWGEWTLSWPWGDIFGGFGSSFTVGPYSSNAWHADHHSTSPDHPQATKLFRYIGGQSGVTCNVQEASGHFVDQYSLLPASIKQILTPGGGGLKWGVFLYSEKTLFVASFVDGTTEIDNMQSVDSAILGAAVDIWTLVNSTLNAGDPLPAIRQVFMLEASMSEMLKLLFYGSGTSGFNSSTHDPLGLGLGIAIPGELLDTEFEDSCDALPGATDSLVCVVDKPVKIADVLGGDLTLRLAFLRWKQGHLNFCTWITPTAAASIAALDETNKAEPSGNIVNHRSASLESDELSRDIVTIAYNRDFTDNSTGNTYRSKLILEDRVDVDDSGGEGKPITINARNSYGQFQNTGTGIEQLAPNFLASFALFSRPKRKTTRSIDQRFFEDITVGDVVVVSDKFARDPATGQRGIAGRPAMITRHHSDFGGSQPAANKPTVQSQGGEVDLFFLDVNRVATYAPAALVDETATNAGYDSTNHILTVYAHEHSESSEEVDAANFADGDDVLIVEIDPANPASPTYWQRTIATGGVSGNTLKLTSALSSPSWDSSKRYRVTYDHFAADQTTQQVFAFQALESAGSVESTGAPFQYGIAQGTTFTVNADAYAELESTLAYGDGKPRDVGYERGLVRTLNNLIDRKTAHQSPMLSSTILENTTYSSGSGYQLQAVCPIFLGGDRWPVNQTRSLRVAPFFRSSTGASVTVRVTLCQAPTTSATKNDVALPTPNASATWTTTSTTWQTGSEQSLSLMFKPAANGLMWLHVETTIHGQTRLLSQCVESKRS